jgi:hypothetical protein
LSQQSEVIATINEGLSLGLAAKADKAEMLGKIANKAGHEDIEKTYKAMAQQHTALTEEMAASEERKVGEFSTTTFPQCSLRFAPKKRQIYKSLP